MKFLKIILIIVLLSVTIPLFSYGDGTITSGDKTIYLCPEPEEKSILNEWFENLPITEKMKLYTYWHGLNHYRSEFDDRLMWLEERVETLKTNFGSLYKFKHWYGLRIEANERWIEEIRKVLEDELPDTILPVAGGG